jgi:molybdopterin molybdotransferase
MLKSFEAAQDIILTNVGPSSPVMLPLSESAGKVLAQDIVAPCDLPRWDNSAMDGYAVRADDCKAGAVLQVTGFIQAGGQAEPAVEPGCAVKIMTGAPVPAGADAIVPVEETEEQEDQVRIVGKVKIRDHLRFRGEDISAGEVVIPSIATPRLWLRLSRQPVPSRSSSGLPVTPLRACGKSLYRVCSSTLW